MRRGDDARVDDADGTRRHDETGRRPASSNSGRVVDDREAVLEDVASSTYDVAIVGGGIAGAGVARDAAMRGLDTVLVEQNDFASGTTAYSTRLIHGGLRYLEQLDFRLVFESLRERETLADIAPHLVEPLAFLVPQYDEGLAERLKLRLGMVLYDVLSYGKTMPRHEHLSVSELAAREPALPEDGLHGGFVYHDRQAAFVERLVVENVLDAAGHGADVLNHVEATDVRTDGDRVTGVAVRDAVTGTEVDLASETVVNAAGPWVDGIADGADLVRPSKGVHLVVPSLTDHALTLPTTDDRIVFVVPWNDLSLVGTTDTDFEGDPAEARADAADVEYLLDEAGRYFPDLDEDDVLYTYAGVRPLYDPGTADDVSDVSRRHRVVDHGGARAGLFSLVGAKITAYRHAAEEVTDAVAAYLGVDAPRRTDATPLPGARGDALGDAGRFDGNADGPAGDADGPAGDADGPAGDADGPAGDADSSAGGTDSTVAETDSSPGDTDSTVDDTDSTVRDTDVPPPTVAHLEDLYGTRAGAVVERTERDPRLAEPLCEHTDDILAQVTVAVEEEYARSVADVMLRRCTVGYEPCEGLDAVETVAAHVADLLDWDAEREQSEIEQYEAVVDRRHAYAEEE